MKLTYLAAALSLASGITFASLPADAANFSFVSDVPGLSFSFSINPDNPAIEDSSHSGGRTVFLGGSPNGLSQVTVSTQNGGLPYDANITFYNSSTFGGLTIGNSDVDLGGDQLYTGPESAPVFVAGTYNLYQFTQDLEFTLADTRFGILTITTDQEPPPPTVPEPASLALLGTGLLGLAATRRRRA